MRGSVFASEQAWRGEATSDSQRPHRALRPARPGLSPHPSPPLLCVRPAAPAPPPAPGLEADSSLRVFKAPFRNLLPAQRGREIPGAIAPRSGRGARGERPAPGYFQTEARAHTPTHPDTRARARTHTHTHTHTPIYIGGGGGCGRGGGGERRNDGAEPADPGWKQVRRAKARPGISVPRACHRPQGTVHAEEERLD